MRQIVLFAAVLLAACGQSAEQPQPTATPTETATPLPAPESLVGEYRVAGIDGEPLDAPFGVALSISEDRISYEPACAGFAWNYTYADGALSLSGGLDAAAAATPCAEPVHPALVQLASALTAAEKVRRTPENAIELSGKGRSVVLFSQ